jgi:hypothetical protein
VTAASYDRGMRRANTREQGKAVTRVGRGHFAPGVSGNPNGRPKVVAEIRDLARVHGPHAIARLVELSRSRDGAVAVNACRTLLDRGYGRPEQAIAVTNIPFTGEAVTISDPIEAARVYRDLMGGSIAIEAVRFEATCERGVPSDALSASPSGRPAEAPAALIERQADQSGSQ